MAYKFQSGLARLSGTIAMDGASDTLQVSGAIDLANNAIAVSDINLGGATSYNLAGGSDGALQHSDELIVMDDSDSDAGKVMTLAQMATYMSGADPSFLQVNQATQAASGSFRVVGHSISGSAALEVVGQSFLQGKVNASGAIEAEGSITAGSSFIIGSADLNETDLEKLDGITNGTVAASKAVVVDSDKDASGFRTVSGSGNVTFLGNAAFDGSVTAGTSIIIGSADLNEADMEKLDGITDGTVAANKAVVVDSNKDADGFRNVSGSGQFDVGNLKVNTSKFTVDSDGEISGSGALQLVGAATIQGNITTSGSFIIGNASMDETDLEKLDGITNGTAAANKAVVLDGNKDITGIRNLVIAGDLDVAGAINRVTTNETELAIEDVRIIIGSGSAGASQLDGGGIFFGSPGSGKAIAEIAFNDAAEDELVFAFSGSEAFKVDSGGDLTAQGDLTIAGAIAGATTIGASGVATVGGLTVGSAVLNEADLEQIDDLTAGTVTVSKAVVVNATKDITSFNSLTAVAVTGSVSVSSPSGSITDLFVGDDLEVKGNLVSHAANTHHGVATHNANINVTGAVGVGALIASSVVSAAGIDATNVGAGALTTTHNGQLGSIQVTGSTQLGYSSSFAAGGSLQAVSNTVLVGGLVASGRNNIVSGSLAAEGAPSFLEVIPSGSEDIKLFVEPPAVTAGGKMITIKYFGQDGVLVLTGSGASNMTFDGLAALTMSSPFAAVNLFWNGSAYSIY